MQNPKKEKVKSITDILEEIVRCVTAPSFCVMPWKCVTMAVGDRTDPLVKKSVVHIYKTTMNGQNIFQIKVHNCKKDVCDHPICTNDCQTNRQTNNQEEKETIQSEIHKRKRKKRNKYSDGNKEMTGCCLVNNAFDKFEKNSILKEHQGSKPRNPNSHKNKRNTKKLEDKEKPSCTLQIFAEGKTRKLNFQLHPAMKVFLGKALDRIEGHDSKQPTINSPSDRMPDPCDELQEKITDGYKSKSMKKPSRNSQSCNNKRRTESVEEFEINLPDNTCLLDDNLEELYKNQLLPEVSNDISKRVCHWDINRIPCHLENNRISSELKINRYLLDDIVPTQQLHSGRGNSCKETELHLGRAPQKTHIDQLKRDNTQQNTITVPMPESYHERGIKYNRNERNLVADEESFRPPDIYHRTFHSHQDYNCNPLSGLMSNVKQNPTDSSRNIFSENEHSPHSYSNRSPCFQNRTKDNMIRTPLDYHANNNEHIANDIRNINNRNYSISDNRASMYSADYPNSPPIYRSKTGFFSPPIPHETFPLSNEYGSFFTNESNRFYGNQYYDISNHERECLNMRAAPLQDRKISYNQHDTNSPKKYIDRETQISQEGRENEKESYRFDRYHFANNRHAYSGSEKKKFISETNKPEHSTHLEDLPTSDLSHNYRKNNVRNVDDHEESIHNDASEKHTYDYYRYDSPNETEVASEVRKDHRSKRKNHKETEKKKSNSDTRKPASSTSAQHLPSCSNIIKSKKNLNNQKVTKISNIDNNPSHFSETKENKLFARKDKKNRNEKCYVDKAYFLENINKMFKNADPNYEVINYPRIPKENEDEHLLEQRENCRKFKQSIPSKIASEDKIMDRLKINTRKVKTENSKKSQKTVLYHGKTMKKPHTTIKRTQSVETTDSSNCFAEDIYINDASEKSSGMLPFLYHFPEDFSSYQLFKPNQDRNGKESHSREKINGTEEGLYDDEYNSKFFCFPSQISWDHYGNLQQIIPNINQNHCLKVENARSGKSFEPKQKIISEDESSKPCQACCKDLCENKTGEKSLGISHESRDFCNENMKENNSQYNAMTKLEKSYRSKNIHNKGLPLCDPTSLKLSGEQKPSNCPIANPNSESDQACQIDNVERRGIKSNILYNNLKAQTATIAGENLQKKESKMIHSQSVKKFFSHAKEYLNFRKYSTSSIKSGVSNNVLQVGQLNSTSQFGSVVDEGPIVVNNKHSVEASNNKKNPDGSNINKKQCRNTEPKPSPENNIVVPQSENVQGSLSIKLKPTDVFRNNTTIVRNFSGIKMFKPDTNTRNQANLKDDKYRLYGNNEQTVDRPSIEDNNPHFIKNEFKILESESECEGFSDEMYCYSSNDSQSEVAKNWVAKTRKKCNSYPNRAMVSRKSSSLSIYSSGSNFSSCEVKKEEKSEKNDKNTMINATIALSSDTKKENKNKIKTKGQYQTNQYSMQKSDHKFSNLFSNSIKNNYKKIKGLVKRNHKRNKSKSPRRVPVLKSSSCTETRSHTLLTPVTSTYTSTKSGDGTVVTENTTGEKFCNDSTTNNYFSDSYNAKSDPIIRKIEPVTWQKFVSRRFSLQRAEITDTENMETENSSTSDNSIDESNLNEPLRYRILQPLSSAHDFIYSNNPTTLSNNHSSMSEPMVQRRGANACRWNHPVHSETMDENNQSDETAQASSCFENPMVDPKTGFRPIFST